MSLNIFLKSTIQKFLILLALFGITQNVLAHTVLELPQVTELKKSANSVVIGHGCSGAPVIGTSVVFPDGESSIITAGGDPHSGPVSDFIQNWGNLIQLLQNRSVFTEQAKKLDGNGNTVGFWSGGGRGMAADLNANIPFTLSAALINPESCAASVRLAVAIVDICTITTIDNFSDEVVALWTPAVGSKFDGASGGHGYDSPAFLTINRDLESNPLPESCGGNGIEVLVKPSAAQINRDMPIIFDGSQVWPQP